MARNKLAPFLLDLRRALAGFRSGVGGLVLFPALYENLQVAPQTQHLHREYSAFNIQLSKTRKMDRQMFGRVLNLFDQLLRVVNILCEPGKVAFQQRALQIHFAILQARSSKRNRPFIPVLAGGNA